MPFPNGAPSTHSHRTRPGSPLNEGNARAELSGEQGVLLRAFADDDHLGARLMGGDSGAQASGPRADHQHVGHLRADAPAGNTPAHLFAPFILPRADPSSSRGTGG